MTPLRRANHLLHLFAVLFVAAALVACDPDAASNAPVDENSDAEAVELPETNRYQIDTPYGAMVIELFDETPEHRDNFKRLVDDAFYDSTTFHRVIEGFVIQGGDPNSRDDPDNVGQGGPGYTLPAEILPEFFHRRGALAAAREGDEVNPERRSSGSQFYIVQGRSFDEESLDEMEQEVRSRLDDEDFSFSDEAREAYLEEGGTPQLDMQYTVFGQLVEGFDVLDQIAASDTPRSTEQPEPGPHVDRPLEPVHMTISPVEQ